MSAWHIERAQQAFAAIIIIVTITIITTLYMIKLSDLQGDGKSWNDWRWEEEVYKWVWKVRASPPIHAVLNLQRCSGWEAQRETQVPLWEEQALELRRLDYTSFYTSCTSTSPAT